jgi:hypothetical protein
MGLETTRIFSLRDYDLAATLNSGQAFRWIQHDQCWVGVIGRHWVRLHSGPGSLTAETAEPVTDWDWLVQYLQLDVSGLVSPFLDQADRADPANRGRPVPMLRRAPGGGAWLPVGFYLSFRRAPGARHGGGIARL